MFGPRPFLGGLSIGKVIGGISRTLGVVNQIIPLYKEAKPMINNAKTAINFLREFSNTTTNKVMTNTAKNLKPLKEKIQLVTNSETKNGPTFFQ